MATFRQIRARWAALDSLPKLSLIALVTGLVSALCVVGFRYSIELGQSFLLPTNKLALGFDANYEGLPTPLRFLFPFLGAVIIGFIFQGVSAAHRRLGISHVLEHVTYFHGHLPIKNAIVQFITGALSIISGHSVGREGPSIHLGATSSDCLARAFRLNTQERRVMISSGVAAAIAASFNTPLAGVIFAMEVIMMEYSVTGFIPVILASVVGALVTQAFYGDEIVFLAPKLHLISLYEIPFLVLLGVIIGCSAAFFILFLRKLSWSTQEWPILIKMTLAGILLGLISIYVPASMGIGYTAVNAALISDATLGFLLTLFVFKLLASGIAIGLGLPGGLIGPTIVIGASLGGAFGLLGSDIFPEISSHIGFYTLLGMAAMMGATLQAPLAALMAILELSTNPHIIMPGMLVVVTACLFSSQVLKQDSVFLELLGDRGFAKDKHYVRKNQDKNDVVG